MQKDKIPALRERAFSLAEEKTIPESEFRQWQDDVINALEEPEAIEEFKSIFNQSELPHFLPERMKSVLGDNYIDRDNRRRTCLYEAAEFLLSLQ